MAAALFYGDAAERRRTFGLTGMMNPGSSGISGRPGSSTFCAFEEAEPSLEASAPSVHPLGESVSQA
jgi:hypothetical protein